jgi:Domain of unknown function (DUF4395)
VRGADGDRSAGSAVQRQTWLGAAATAATAAALAAAFLNAAFGFCLGCEVYLLIRRIRPGRRTLALADADKEG